jgi:predicted transcriptional regulator of viral defense system
LCSLAEGRPGGHFYLSERTAAELLEMSKTAARKALGRLMESGIIVRVRKGTYHDRRNSAFVYRGRGEAEK